MLIPDEAHDLLVASGLGVSAEVRDAGHGQVGLTIAVPAELIPTQRRPAGGELILGLEVIGSRRPMRSSAVKALIERTRARPAGPLGVLLICPAATPLLRRQAIQAGVSLIALNHGSWGGADGHLMLGPDQVLPLRRAGERPVTPVPRPRSWTYWHVLRAVALAPGVTQRDLAAATGVSQARVSQLLGAAVRSGLLVRGAAHRVAGQAPDGAAGGRAERLVDPAPGSRARSWLVADWPRLLHHWRASYPGPGGIATHWYGLDALSDQVDTTLAVLSSPGHSSPGHGPDRPARVSGDVAADVLAPWGRPRRAVVYTARGADLGTAGLTPCAAAEATLTLLVPEDPGVLQEIGRVSRFPGSEAARWPLADPLQILLDLVTGPSVDADQMADHFERWILARTGPAGGERG